ncbi:MAG TPA: cytochrome P450 [Solirubrobacteraceae bacterium]|nr:cytochrome P450 [Solirubrobacteraceae bacterium]
MSTFEGLPPGPPLPRAVQTIGFMFFGPRFVNACRRRYGDAVTFGTLFDERFVMVFHPALIKEVFQGPHEQLRAGEANVMLGPIVGERSVLLLDGAQHLRHRRLLGAPFHGRRMQAFADTMVASTDLEIDSWPVGEPFPLLPTMQALTLRVILSAVFGYEPGPEEEELRRRLRAMLEPLSRPRAMMLLAAMPHVRGDRAAVTARFEVARREVDEVLYAEIARRRADPDALEGRDDIFSALLLAEDEDGQLLSDREVRDELVTLLLAGHETTATGLAWCFDLLLHHPAVLQRARDGDERYLDAVVKESLRVRPVIPGVGRVVRGEPFRLNGYEIPPGIEINPSIRLIHRRKDLYPDASAFRPERFLVENPPDTYTWIPFGGGTRRCIGASFALMEMRIVVARVLERAAGLRAADPKPAKVQFRGITLAPKDGARVVLDRAPAGVVREASIAGATGSGGRL